MQVYKLFAGVKTKQKGLKRNRRKRLPHCLLKATPQTPETVGNPKNWNLKGATAESEITPS